MSFEKISYKVENDIAIVAFDDPATLNACGMDTCDELIYAFELAADEARATIVTGNGRGFCSGANLTATAGRTYKGKPDAGLGLATTYNRFMQVMQDHPHPILTAVNGPAAGIGCSIALMGDMIICAENAYFLQAFRRIGLVPDGGSTWLLPRMVGRARAMELVLLGDKLPAATAMDWGMINRVVSNEELMPTTLEFANRMATGPSLALGLARQLVGRAESLTFNEGLHAERLAQQKAGRSEDFREGVMAFLEKRPAKFTGK